LCCITGLSACQGCRALIWILVSFISDPSVTIKHVLIFSHRFVGVPGLSCFDLDTFLAMTERSRKWQCPHSMRNTTIRELHADTFVSRLLKFHEVG